MTTQKKVAARTAASTTGFHSLGEPCSGQQALAERCTAAIRREGISVSFAARQTIYRMGETFEHLMLVEQGWVVLHESSEAGDRQILDFRGAGSVLLPSATPDHAMSWSAEWLTAGKAVMIAPFALQRLIEASRDFLEWEACLREAELQRAYAGILNMGRRSGRQRLAALLSRLHHDGQMRGCNGHLPVSQIDLADALGFTTVYVNQLIKALKTEGVIELAGRKLVVADAERLYRIGEFSPVVDLETRAGDGRRRVANDEAAPGR
jgi:CRP-like cAMP-binding protein